MQHVAYRELWDLRNHITETINIPGRNTTPWTLVGPIL